MTMKIGKVYWNYVERTFRSSITDDNILLSGRDLANFCLCKGKHVNIKTMRRHRQIFIERFVRDELEPAFRAMVKWNLVLANKMVTTGLDVASIYGQNLLDLESEERQ